MKFVNEFLGNDAGSDLNSYGHRCLEYDKLNLKNYILFAGDNQCLSLHIPIHQTFPYIVSQITKTEFYNLSIFNGGVDAILYNTILWFNKHKFLPKAYIIGSEFLNSIIISDENYENISYGNLDDEYVKDVLHYGNYVGFFNLRNQLANNLIDQIVKVPIIQINFTNCQKLLTNTNYEINTDLNYDHTSLAMQIANCITKLKDIRKP